MKLGRPGPERVRPGAEILEWILVTAILSLAIYVVLQAFGGSFGPLLQQASDLWRSLIQHS